jgi:hypothetical protein
MHVTLQVEENIVVIKLHELVDLMSIHWNDLRRLFLQNLALVHNYDDCFLYTWVTPVRKQLHGVPITQPWPYDHICILLPILRESTMPSS